MRKINEKDMLRMIEGNEELMKLLLDLLKGLLEKGYLEA